MSSLSIEMETCLKNGVHPKSPGSPLDDKNLSASEQNYLKTFVQILEAEDDIKFLQEYLTISTVKFENLFYLRLLAKAIEEKRSQNVVAAILNDVKNIDYVSDDDYGRNQYIIAVLCRAKSFEILKQLLSKKDLKLPSMLEILDTLITELDEELFDTWFDFIMEFDKNIDVNAKYNKNQLLLKTALLEKNNKAIQKLCKAGAFIGFRFWTEDNEYEYMVDRMEPNVLEEILDSCITASDDSNSKSHDFLIKFNYKNFVCPRAYLKYENEMSPIACMLKSKELLPLLTHPIITSLMMQKWYCISWLYYLHICLYGSYHLSMTLYIIFKCEELKYNNEFMFAATIYSSIGICYLIIRQIMKFLRSPKYFVTNSNNYLILILIGVSIFIRITDFEPFYVKIVIVFQLLLMALELALLVRYLTLLSISTHMLMLQQVLISFFKSFTLYSLFVLMFVICFYVLFGIGNKHLQLEDDLRNPIFENILLLIPKMMAMTVGELDYGSLNFYSPFAYVFFIFFLVCTTVVLMNLLNGLAVSDIQTIKDQAEFNELTCRAKLLINDYSNFLHKNEPNPKCFCKWSIIIQPNYKNCPNKVFYPAQCGVCCPKDKKENKTSESKLIAKVLSSDENVRALWDSLNRKCSAMTSSIVRKAILIIKKEKSAEWQETRLWSIEENVKKILENLKME